MRTVCLLVKVEILSLLRVWGLSSGWFRAWLPAGCGFCGLRGGSTICIAEREAKYRTNTEAPLFIIIVQCNQCEKDFKYENCLKIHLGKAHNSSDPEKVRERPTIEPTQRRLSSYHDYPAGDGIGRRMFWTRWKKKENKNAEWFQEVHWPGEAAFVCATFDYSPKLSKLSRSTVVCKKTL